MTNNSETHSDETAPSQLPEVLPSPGEIVQKRRAEYNRLVRQARLASLLLEKVEFKIQPEALGIKESLLVRNLSPTTRVLSSGIEDGTCVASVVWEVTFKFKTKNVVRCSASYVIRYDGIADCSEEAVSVFIEHVGKTATYAYFRALYAHLDWSANLGSQPLPVLQLRPNL
jgi:hypothetical protein